jgi:hypothetical protein
LFFGSLFGTLITLLFTFHSFSRGYAEGFEDRPETINPFGTILADNADLDEIMVIRYDDQLPHRYKRIID